MLEPIKKIEITPQEALKKLMEAPIEKSALVVEKSDITIKQSDDPDCFNRFTIDYTCKGQVVKITQHQESAGFFARITYIGQEFTACDEYLNYEVRYFHQPLTVDEVKTMSYQGVKSYLEKFQCRRLPQTQPLRQEAEIVVKAIFDKELTFTNFDDLFEVVKRLLLCLPNKFGRIGEFKTPSPHSYKWGEVLLPNEILGRDLSSYKKKQLSYDDRKRVVFAVFLNMERIVVTPGEANGRYWIPGKEPVYGDFYLSWSRN
ncbi:hypothetical protein VF04_04085 [Nostoc linckia z7]|uniref:Uncharacterized protein n=2 Tax=Nostoc linckia TaxID=92942 RepID=A0A9Q6END1_NOSLI|nr:hypothetical protein [Nostoc linckia]PHK42892.1 hypothetical protein VF12_00785 [Nostoc linckia z15]PHK48049.1 hypothetical protein VF13_01760 [Nostoc linckia z16]PHJ64969.1 hypothetical protein VF02_11570 [Nostoc linckia z1]PHJ70147.1 hypothetical protein VF05_11730 [Nostoc linckia z3]PHJ75048.1 hypothetical protein VF03_11890 [Nostoc linckia z2]